MEYDEFYFAALGKRGIYIWWYWCLPRVWNDSQGCCTIPLFNLLSCFATWSLFLIGQTVCSPNILRTVQRTIIYFSVELLVRWTWFGQVDKLDFVLNWLIMRCKLQPKLAAKAQQTAWSKCRLQSRQVKSIYFNHPSQSNSTVILYPRDTAATPTSQQIGQFPLKRVKYQHHHPLFFFFLPHPQESSLCSQPIRGKICWIGRIFPKHVEQSFLNPEYSFVTVQWIPWTRFAKQTFAQF